MKTLKTELEKPIEQEPVIVQKPEVEEKPITSELSCSELESSPQVRGGLDAFIAGMGLLILR